jgi:hypothetical protein
MAAVSPVLIFIVNILSANAEIDYKNENITRHCVLLSPGPVMIIFQLVTR